MYLDQQTGAPHALHRLKSFVSMLNNRDLIQMGLGITQFVGFAKIASRQLVKPDCQIKATFGAVVFPKQVLNDYK